MSELEILKRRQYKLNRKKWTMIQMIAIVLAAIVAVGSFLIYDRMNQTYYIEYTENAKIDYRVEYRENGFFEDTWQTSGQAYIASLINSMEADFSYGLNMGVANVGFDYTYGIQAKLLVADKNTGDTYYSFTEDLIPQTQMSNRRTRGVSVAEKVVIDYVKYNEIASNFVKTYNLKSASCTLIVTMKVEIGRAHV